MNIYTHISKNAQRAVQHALNTGNEHYARLLQEGANALATDEERDYIDQRGLESTFHHIASWCDTEKDTQVTYMGARLHRSNSIEETIEQWFNTHYNQHPKFDTPEQALDTFFNML